jgi:hypothetical protein
LAIQRVTLDIASSISRNGSITLCLREMPINAMPTQIQKTTTAGTRFSDRERKGFAGM